MWTYIQGRCGVYYWKGLSRLRFGGLIFGRAYFWRWGGGGGLLEFYVFFYSSRLLDFPLIKDPVLSIMLHVPP